MRACKLVRFVCVCVCEGVCVCVCVCAREEFKRTGADLIFLLLEAKKFCFLPHEKVFILLLNGMMGSVGSAAYSFHLGLAFQDTLAKLVLQLCNASLQCVELSPVIGSCLVQLIAVDSSELLRC